MGLKPVSRCYTCGRFVSRGIFNHAKHAWDDCPEKQIIIFSFDPKKCKLIKRKNL